jgi:hypothetical protein
VAQVVCFAGSGQGANEQFALREGDLYTAHPRCAIGSNSREHMVLVCSEPSSDCLGECWFVVAEAFQLTMPRR